MKIQIITIITIMSIISLAGAVDIYSGQDYSFESEEFDYYEVIGNASSIEGMNIEWLDGNTTIIFDKGFVSDSFTLILFNPEKEIITEHHYSSGGGSSGGSRIIYRDRNVTDYEVVESKGEGEVVTETVTETETVVESETPFWVWCVVGILFVIIIIGILNYFYGREGLNTN